jgi:hypothetical protein
MRCAASRLFAVGIAFLLSGTTFLCGRPNPIKDPSLQSANDDVAVEDLLTNLGMKNSVTFTLEEAIGKDGMMGPIRTSVHRRISEGSALTGVLDELSQSVPHFTWRADASNPKIIHIVDERLLHRRTYALDMVIKELDFAGKVNRLVDAIAAKGIPVSSLGGADVVDAMVTDYRTELQVKGKDLRVRDALTDFVPLEGRGPILWVAETRLEGPDQTSYIRFRGAPPRNTIPKQ